MRLFNHKPPHPIHLCSAGRREPLTWMGCPVCSYRTVESSYEPAKTCEGRWFGSHEPAVMAPVEPMEALGATVKACDHDPDLIARVLP